MERIDIWDTNTAIYFLQGYLTQSRLHHRIRTRTICLSFISEMELLSWPSMTESDGSTIRRFLFSVQIFDLNEALKKEAVALRKRYKLKLPDAIIAATALYLKGPLITNDRKDFSNVNEIECINPLE